MVVQARVQINLQGLVNLQSHIPNSTQRETRKTMELFYVAVNKVTYTKKMFSLPYFLQINIFEGVNFKIRK